MQQTQTRQQDYPAFRLPGQTVSPTELSRQLRQGQGGYLPARRQVVGLSLLAAATMGIVTLYQMGLVKHLPEPPLPGFDADQVDASAEAYARFAMPDGALGLASYAGTLLLAAMGDQNRHQTQPLIPLALAAKAAFDAVEAGRLTWDQWAKHRAFCFWCLVGAGATFLTLPLTLPEARAAWRELTNA